MFLNSVEVRYNYFIVHYIILRLQITPFNLYGYLQQQKAKYVFFYYLKMCLFSLGKRTCKVTQYNK